MKLVVPSSLCSFFVVIWWMAIEASFVPKCHFQKVWFWVAIKVWLFVKPALAFLNNQDLSPWRFEWKLRTLYSASAFCGKTCGGFVTALCSTLSQMAFTALWKGYLWDSDLPNFSSQKYTCRQPWTQMAACRSPWWEYSPPKTIYLVRKYFLKIRKVFLKEKKTMRKFLSLQDNISHVFLV